jgi:hypothetical protein
MVYSLSGLLRHHRYFTRDTHNLTKTTKSTADVTGGNPNAVMKSLS